MIVCGTGPGLSLHRFFPILARIARGLDCIYLVFVIRLRPWAADSSVIRLDLICHMIGWLACRIKLSSLLHVAMSLRVGSLQFFFKDVNIEQARATAASQSTEGHDMVAVSLSDGHSPLPHASTTCKPTHATLTDEAHQ